MSIDTALLPQPASGGKISLKNVPINLLKKEAYYYPVKYNADPSSVDRIAHEIRLSKNIAGQVLAVKRADNQLEVIYGSEYIQAAILADRTSLACYIAGYSKYEAISLCYKLHERHLTILDKALTAAKIQQYLQGGTKRTSKRTIAKILNIDHQYLTDFDRIRKMPDDVKRAIQAGKLVSSSVRFLAYQKPLDQVKVINEIEAGRIKTFLQLKEFITGKKQKRKTLPTPKPEESTDSLRSTDNNEKEQSWYQAEDKYSLSIQEQISNTVAVPCIIKYHSKLDFKLGGAFFFTSSNIQILTGVADRLVDIERSIDCSLEWRKGKGELTLKFKNLAQQEDIYNCLCGSGF